MKKLKETEKYKESDAVDGVRRQIADTLVSHQKATDKHKFHSVGHQEPSSAGRGLSPMEMLKQTLQSFGVPDNLNWWAIEGDKAEILEKSWTDMVFSHKSMPKTQRHQQEAIWELLYTEFMYINKLTIITDLVLAALEHVHQQGFLLKITSAHLFSNISAIVDAHKCFWLEVLYPMLQNVRLTGQPFDPLKLEPGCLQFVDRFSAYFDYCWEEERNLDFTRRQLEVNPHFSIFLKWVETHPQCGRMRLNDMQAKPHQRITKYPLLLKAILKATQDPYTQQALNRMINSVSQFLDSINDYLILKDDELALFALSQKIEGYELQGMSEEIEKHMQEFCRFDLTTPIRGTETNVIRKLLMGETLKVRGRKDSKLEVVVLLFTDVLLLTKTQKKSDKQKVVRPPLSLERIHCAELKDGYSFVLVEVSDLGCPVSVYSVSTPSPESCAAWITTIHQAQEALQSLRKMEMVEGEEASDHILEDSDQFPPTCKLNSNETLEQSKYKSNFAPLSFTTIQLEKGEENLHGQNVQAYFLSKPMQNGDTKLNNEHNMPQETKRRESSNGYCENSDILNNQTVERRVTWNHKVHSQKDYNAFPQQNLLETNECADPHHLLVGDLMENKLSTSSQFLLPSKFTPIESEISVTQQQSQKPDLRQDSCSHQSGDENESLSEPWTFTRMLNSPRLRKKRPMNSQPSAAPQEPGGMSADVVSPNSVSDSEEDHNVSRPSNTSVKSQDHLVLKMSSVKQNRGVFWNAPHERSSETESELPKETHNENSLKIPNIKTQRSESLHELQSSPLQSLLNRAKERDRERGMAKREGKHIKKTYLQSYNQDCTTVTISSASEGEKDATTEKPGLRTRWSHTGTETRVVSSENDRKNRPVTPLGVKVDWSGWCFDDEAVLEFTGLDDETSDWFEQTLTMTKLRKTPRHSDADYSEV